MKTVLFSFLMSLIVSVPCMAQDSARVVEQGSYTWSSGQPGPLPVYVKFYSSKSNNILDSTAVHKAVSSALQFNNLPPDVTVSGMSTPVPKDRLYLYLEVSIYSGGEMHYEAEVIGKNDDSRSYGSESKSILRDQLDAALSLMGQAHNSISRVKQLYDIQAPYSSIH